jgi:serine/threonine-protein phosphatase 2B catalytic subunit
MLLAVLSVCSEEELELTDADTESDVVVTVGEPTPSPEEIQRRRQEIKSKIMAVGKMQKVFQILRSVPIFCALSSTPW